MDTSSTSHATVVEDSNNSEAFEKPIKKIKRTQANQESMGVPSSGATASPSKNKDIHLDPTAEQEQPIKRRRLESAGTEDQANWTPETHVMESLRRFLQRRNVSLPEEEYAKIKAVVKARPNRRFGSHFDEANYVVKYEYEGEVFSTKGELFKALFTPPTTERPSSRAEMHADARSRLEQLRLPFVFKDFSSHHYTFELVSAGQLNPSPEFHNAVQLYPVGYHVRIKPEPGFDTTLDCEIKDRDGVPEFIIRQDGRHRATASSEAEAWKQIDAPKELFVMQSFFNLEIELLLEGLDGVLDCALYKFHYERGYGKDYSTHDEAMAVKERVLSKLGRAERSKLKQEAKRQSDGLVDKPVVKFKGRRPMTEEERAIKEQERLREKEESRLLKQQNRSLSRESKQLQKQTEKAKVQARKEVLAEAKRCRIEASTQVLNYFDNEEELEASLHCVDTAGGVSDVAASRGADVKELDELLRGLPVCRVTDKEHVGWEDLVAVSSTLLLFRDRLRLNLSPDIDLLASLLHDSTHPPVTQVSLSVADPLPEPGKSEEIKMQDAFSDVDKSRPKMDPVDGEEEWDESEPAKISAPLPLKSPPSGADSAATAKAFIERIFLSLMKLLSEDLHGMLEQSEWAREREKERKKKVRLPLNHLTWAEQARMLLIARLIEDFSDGPVKPEEVVLLIRGNRGVNCRSNKNMARNFRYRFVARSAREAMHKDTGVAMPVCPDTSILPFPPNDHDYRDEKELETSLEEVAADESFPEEYRRCARVLLKLVHLTASKNLMWEVDSNAFPYYYSIVKRPIMFCNIASNLCSQAYGETVTHISLAFYRDVSQAAFNSLIFSEVSLGVQAIKILHALRRHMLHWVWSPSPPPLNLCTDQFCFLSQQQLPSNFHTASIKCGKCSASFSTSYLEDFKHFAHIAPTLEMATNHQEEWVCHFCIAEDSTVANELRYDEHMPAINRLFRVNEWGVSGEIPWMMNGDLSARSAEVLADEEVRVRFEALSILSDPRRMTALSVGDKLVMLRALCDLLKHNSKCADAVNRLYGDCQRLLKNASKEAIREAELLESVKAVLGDGAIIGVFRRLFEGAEGGDLDLIRVTDGRCVICKGSTFEDDMPSEEEVVLCDGCNGEAHLRCLQLAEVPKEAWHCNACAERIANRESSLASAFSDVEKLRNRAAEDQIIDMLIESKVNEEQTDLLSEKCEYCGSSEADLCSPLVVGHCREEHETYLNSRRPATASGVFEGKRNTAVKFLIRGQAFPTPALTVPYFPSIRSEAGHQLRTAITPVVHELCALNMFKARMDKSRHAFRRRRLVAAERVVGMSGLILQPLGFDNSGREYWKLPTSPDLFICKPGADKGDVELHSLLFKSEKPKDKLSDCSAEWLRVKDVAVIRRIVDILGSSTTEAKLKVALSNNFLSDARSEAVAESSKPSLEDTLKSPESSQIRSSSVSDKTPVELALVMAPKCCGIDRNVLISQEEAFDEEQAGDDDDSDAGEEEIIDYKQYFRYTRKALYYAVAVRNRDGKTLHLPKGGVTITYQVHREGDSQALAFTPLDTSWSDGLYYFSCVEFKRSGSYIISFIAEGVHASVLKPLAFPVTVRANTLIYGALSALNRLNGRSYLGERDREIISSKRLFGDKLYDTSSDLRAIKSAILTIYYALPLGSLNTAHAPSDSSDWFSHVAEAEGWTDALDQMWQGRIDGVDSGMALMECLLLLEHYINKQWIDNAQGRLLSALPNAHFAIRCCSLAAVAQRVFALDRALNYDHILTAAKSRTSRGTPRDYSSSEIVRPKSNSRYSLDAVEDPGVLGRSRRQSKPVVHYGSTVSDFDDEEEGRGRRKDGKRRGRNDAAEGEDDEEAGRRPSSAMSVATGVSWTCSFCRTQNGPRARSCSACFARKPVIYVPSKNKQDDEEEEEDDEDDDEDDEEEEVEDENDEEKEEADDGSTGKQKNGNGEEEETTDGALSLETMIQRKEYALARDSDANSATHSTLKASLLSLQILSRLKEYRAPDSALFWVPVDLNSVRGYREKISTPIDLGTIASEVFADKYGADLELFKKRVTLVWDNCKKFNAGRTLAHFAAELSSYFIELCEEFKI